MCVCVDDVVLVCMFYSCLLIVVTGCVHLQQINKYRILASEIMGLPSVGHCDLILLNCEDLKAGLANAARGLADELLSRVSTDHRRQNETYALSLLFYNQICVLFSLVVSQREAVISRVTVICIDGTLCLFLFHVFEYASAHL